MCAHLMRWCGRERGSADIKFILFDKVMNNIQQARPLRKVFWIQSCYSVFSQSELELLNYRQADHSNIQYTLNFKVPVLLYVVNYALPDFADRYRHASVKTNSPNVWNKVFEKPMIRQSTKCKAAFKIKTFCAILHNSSSSDSILTQIPSMVYCII